MARRAMWRAVGVFAALSVVIGGMAVTGHGQVQMAEIPQMGRTIEPSGGAFQTVFEFSIQDIDPLANDESDIRISCFLIQNLGSATNEDIKTVALFDGQDSLIAQGEPADGAEVEVSNCPSGSGSVAFQQFFTKEGPETVQSGSFEVKDGMSRQYKIKVETESTLSLGSRAQGHTLLLDVAIQFQEDVGSPEETSTFTASVTDSSQDAIFNGGINSFQSLDLEPDALQILPGGSSPFGRVAAFEVCDEDSNALPLDLDTIRIQQGPSGNAVGADIMQWKVTVGGSSMTYAMTPGDSLSSGIDIDLTGTTLDADRTITDDACQSFTLSGKPTSTAMRGRTLHPRITLYASEPNSISESVAPSFQVQNTAILGSGILRIEHAQLSLSGGNVPIELVKFPSHGLQSLKIQTNSIQFNPQLMRIEGVEGVGPYAVQTDSFQVDNRAGELRFTLSYVDSADQLGTPQSPSREGAIANIQVSAAAQSRPGNRSQLTFLVDQVQDSQGNDVTNQLVLSSGSVTFLQPGDIDLNGQTMVSDVLKLARELVADVPCGNLTDQQRLVADVAGAVSSGFPEHGIVRTEGTTLTYEPDGQFRGIDHFTYTVHGENMDPVTAEATVVVQPGIVQQANTSTTLQTSPGTPVSFDVDDQVSGEGVAFVEVGTPGDRAPTGKIPACTQDEAAVDPQTNPKFERDGLPDLGSNDVRRIAELSLTAAAENPSGQGTSRPQRSTSRLPGWLSWVGAFIDMPEPTVSLDWQQQEQGRWTLSSAQVEDAGGIQGRIQYDPSAVSIERLRGVNGYEIVAVRRDERRGEVRFVALASSVERPGQHDVLEVETSATADGDATLTLRVDQLVDMEGNVLPFELNASHAIEALSVSALELRRPSSGQWTLNVRGQGVQNVSIQGYDLGGRSRFHESAQGSQLEWRALDERTGRRLANGVYLYLVTVEGVNGETWRSDVRKLVVLR